jgi:hypothetical protein
LVPKPVGFTPGAQSIPTRLFQNMVFFVESYVWWNWIVASGVTRVAAKDTVNTKADTAKNTIF